MKLIAIQDFSWAHRGCIVQAYAVGDDIETDEQDMVDVTIREGWAKPGDDETKPSKPVSKKPAENKAKPGAPENK
jgi:hypothetical protein